MFDFDLADRVDDLICVFEGPGGGDSDMDTISMLLTGWIIFFFCSIALLKFIYVRYLKKSQSLPKSTISVSDNGGISKVAVPDQAITQKKCQNIESKISAQVKPPRKSATVSSEVDGHVVRYICNGPDKAVADFVSQCYSWLYSTETRNHQEWVQVRDTFIDTINKTLRDSKKENLVFASVVDIALNEEISLSNLFAECGHPNNIKITCDSESKLRGVLSLYSADSGSRSCKFFIDRISGRFNILLDCEEELAIVKFDGWPEICFGIEAGPDNKQDPKLIEDLVDRVSAAIRNVVLEIELRRFLTFPKPPTSFVPKTRAQEEKYLLVTVVGGKDIGLHKGCEEPYCVIETDDPPQKFQTGAKMKGSPLWNESFVLNLLSGSGEILFEVYDKVATRFLGCHIISADEIGSELNRVLPLKSRKMEISEQITGVLQVQFKFLDEKEYLQKTPNFNSTLPNGSVNASNAKVNNGQWEISTTTAGAAKKGQNCDSGIPGNDVQNTLIIHPARKGSFNQLIRPIVKIERRPNGYYFELGDPKIEDQEQRKQNAFEDCETGIEGQYGEERGRRRTRRGDIFTSIRRRFSKGRSRSVTNPEDELTMDSTKDDAFNRSVSVDRKSLNSTNQLGIGMSSARSSASELSGLSGYSTTTFIHENSTLVIECIENRVRKYFLVPPHLAETGKWKKRGKKLHIYNDHTFVAKHIAGGSICTVCNGRFAFSLGKQGYRCRDCKLVCHKECHVRVNSFCSSTSVYDIELGTAKCEPGAVKTCDNGYVCSGEKTSLTNSSVSTTNGVILTNDSKTKNPSGNNLKKSRTNSKLKLNIFRKGSKLGKIPEENAIAAGEQTVPLAESTKIESQ